MGMSINIISAIKYTYVHITNRFNFQALLGCTVQLEIEPAHVRQFRRAEKADENFFGQPQNAGPSRLSPAVLAHLVG